MANLTLEEREKLKSDWQALRTKNEDARLDQEDNFVKDKVTTPEVDDFLYKPDDSSAVDGKKKRTVDKIKDNVITVNFTKGDT